MNDLRRRVTNLEAAGPECPGHDRRIYMAPERPLERCELCGAPFEAFEFTIRLDGPDPEGDHEDH